MVSDSGRQVSFRVCPTIESEAQRPLMQQNITEDTCFKRQERAYHKCFRCAFQELSRGKREIAKIRMN